ncbi:hypothetical protein LF63_0114700 [Oleiagrimonas soli]|uniref:Uncharacterized protein n=1 Tax=Oleiagrimonas soli TaxID=1543381 RepID=A0A099CUU2_9GAMM|nr:hypothetical protein LF63_0114700 [Oleiagrimonas soli]
MDVFVFENDSFFDMSRNKLLNISLIMNCVPINADGLGALAWALSDADKDVGIMFAKSVYHGENIFQKLRLLPLEIFGVQLLSADGSRLSTYNVWLFFVVNRSAFALLQ